MGKSKTTPALKRLNHYDLDSVLTAFDIEIITDCAFLDQWQAITIIDLPLEDKHILSSSRERLVINGNFWNEPGRRCGRA